MNNLLQCAEKLLFPTHTSSLYIGRIPLSRNFFEKIIFLHTKRDITSYPFYRNFSWNISFVYYLLFLKQIILLLSLLRKFLLLPQQRLQQFLFPLLTLLHPQFLLTLHPRILHLPEFHLHLYPA